MSEARTTSSGASGSKVPWLAGGLRARSLADRVSESPVHQDEVKIRWVSERECRRPRCRSWLRRMAKAIMRGMDMIKNVQHIHDVLWCAMNRVCGKQYMGIGPMIEITAITETVKGKPKLCGHLLRGQ